MTQALRVGNRLGKYRLERKLGEGGSAVVWQARDTVEGRRVAIKVVLDSVIGEWGRAAVEGEARVAAQLDHPRIAGIRNADWIDHHFVMVTDLARKSLDEYPGARRSPDLALSILADVSEGLAYAHERGLLHRDIKPANIFLYEGRRAKLGDFGTARLAPAATRVLTEVGTFGYMAPEQAYGRARFASDVFSLALTAYELWAERSTGLALRMAPRRRAALHRPLPRARAARDPPRADPRPAQALGRRRRVPRSADEGDRIDRLRPRPLEEEEQDPRAHDPQDRHAPRSLRPRDRVVPQALRARPRSVVRLPRLRRADRGVDEPLPVVRHDAQLLRARDALSRSSARAASVACAPEWRACPTCSRGRFEGNGKPIPHGRHSERTCRRPGCGAPIDRLMRYCPACKQKVARPWKVEGLDPCERCRWPMASRWRFCAWCGKKNSAAMQVSIGRRRRGRGTT
jgi:serine/threonine protein kinase